MTAAAAAAVAIRIKRRLEGDPSASGPPEKLKEGELAFNEVEEVLYVGVSDTASRNSSSAVDETGATIDDGGGE